MKKFIYAFININGNSAAAVTNYLLNNERSVYVAYNKNFSENLQPCVTPISISSKNLTSKTFISDFKKILDTVCKDIWDYVTILPSEAFPLLAINKFESFIAEKDIEYADIINGKFDKNYIYKKKFEEFYFPIGNAFIRKNLTRFCKFLNIKKFKPFGFMLHYGSPFGCFSRKTVDNMLSLYQNKKFCRAFRFLYHPAFYFIPTLFYESIEQNEKPLSEIVLSTDSFVATSQYLYNDHEIIMQSSNKYFVGKLSPYANTIRNKLPFTEMLSKDINLPEIYNDTIHSISKYRIPGLYPSHILQDLYYNNKNYNVIITDKKAQDFIDKFNPQEYALYGHILSKDEIDYGLMEKHPCYGDNIVLRNYKIQNFLYDIINFSDKKIVFLLHPKGNDSIVDIIANDPHSTFFAYADSKYVNLLNIIIKCNSETKTFYYSCDLDINLKNRQQLLKKIDYALLQRFIKQLNKIMYIKNSIIHFMENNQTTN